MTTERKKPIPGYKGYYIGNKGNVYRTAADGSLKKMSPYKSGSGEGYKMIDLRKGGKDHKKLVHRLVAQVFLKKNGKTEIDHKDNNKYNNSSSNLKKVTRQENMDKLRKK